MIYSRDIEALHASRSCSNPSCITRSIKAFPHDQTTSYNTEVTTYNARFATLLSPLAGLLNTRSQCRYDRNGVTFMWCLSVFTFFRGARGAERLAYAKPTLVVNPFVQRKLSYNIETEASACLFQCNHRNQYSNQVYI